MRWHITGQINGTRPSQLAADIRKMGDVVVSRWLLSEREQTPAEMAMQDIEDVAKSDGLIVLIDKRNPHFGLPECGMAIAFNKRVVVIGPRSDPFHYLPTVENYPSTRAFLETREDELSA